MATTAAVREHYDSFALIYRHFWGDHIHHGLFVTGEESPEEAQLRLLHHCMNLAAPKRDELVLDVGCGHGATAVYLARLLGCRVTGLTISDKQACLARQNAERGGLSKRIDIVTGDADRFEFPPETFDVVWTMESSEHFLDKQRYFLNVASTLRPGGRLLLAAWTGSMEMESVRAVAGAFLCAELWTAEEYRAAIEAAGLEIRASEDLTGSVLPTWEICRRHASAATRVIPLLPAAARNFVAGIDVILHAYRSGHLTYSVISAQKPCS